MRNFQKTQKQELCQLCHGKQHSPACLDQVCEACGAKVIAEMLQEWAAENSNKKINWYTWKFVESHVRGKVVKWMTKVQCSDHRPQVLETL